MKKISRIVFLSSLGSCLEYYDFLIYGMVASYISAVFFTEEATINSIFKTFSIFSIGYVARPIGGIIFGAIADRKGRKLSFMLVMSFMALSTLCMGFLPSPSQIGYIAVWLLIVLRFIQGFSYGGEAAATVAIITEHSHPSKIGVNCALMFISTSLGLALASAVLTALTYFFNHEEMLSWGWRIPFIFGGALGIAVYIIRCYLPETPVFEEIKNQQEKNAFFLPFLNLIREFSKESILAIAMNLFTSTLVTTYIFSPAYIRLFYDSTSSQIFELMTLIAILTAITLPFFGWLGDKFGRERVFLFSALLFFPIGYFQFDILRLQTSYSIFIFLLIQQLFICSTMCSVFPLTVTLFPPQVRLTGVGSCYNIAYVLASLVPVTCTYFFTIYFNPIVLYYIQAFVATLSIFFIVISNKVLLKQKIVTT